MQIMQYTKEMLFQLIQTVLNRFCFWDYAAEAHSYLGELFYALQT